ncbi:hypothetical protein EXU29_12450 [Acinetobacter wuhouensis]|uniref:hypothetical protein n=1 Tax=Acinetobacter wuhouensis TaxID=1879050 RepID=UPI001022EB6E|nr:hypothetical protein [Acinetobacter wuhouensis]RZG71927.1 hypothetical protein EXU29_12450 [Acinetobacter wuhouensis]
MELNQASQTFLVFFFVFLFSLIGFAFYVNKNKRLPETPLVNAVQTSILFVGIFTLLVFGASYYFVLADTKPTDQPLKDALSVTASFFGGFATLTAAFIGSKLFNDWRDQHNKQVNSDFIMKFYDNLFEMKATAISVVGYFIDYLNLETLEQRQEQYENLINHNKRLCYLIDYSSQSLSDLAFILDEDDYDKNFKPMIGQLHEKLSILNDFFRLYINNPNAPISSDADQILIEQLPELEEDLYDHYRSFMVELKRYYRA